MTDFSQEEMDEIYDMAVDFLECNYRGDIEDIDVANEPAEKFATGGPRIRVMQSIVKKIGGETI